MDQQMMELTFPESLMENLKKIACEEYGNSEITQKYFETIEECKKDPPISLFVAVLLMAEKVEAKAVSHYYPYYNHKYHQEVSRICKENNLNLSYVKIFLENYDETLSPEDIFRLLINCLENSLN